jgi:hypothetical protein
MIAGRGRPRYRVAIDIPPAGGWRAGNAAAGDFEQRLAAQASPVVREPRLESETRCGGGVRVRIAMTVSTTDPGQAAVIAWDVFQVAAGEDAGVWDMAAAAAEIQPLTWSLSTRAPEHLWGTIGACKGLTCTDR